MTGRQIVVAQHRTSGLPPKSEFNRLWTVGHELAATDMVPRDLRGNGKAVVATMLAGREIGLGPMEALRSFYVVDGKPTMSADLMMTLALRAGHDIYVAKADQHGTTVMARHRDWPDDRDHLEVTFDVEDAASAELVSYVCADAWPRHATEKQERKGRNGSYSRLVCKADERGVRCKDNYRTYGRSMMRARAITEAIRTVAPDVTVGATYTAEELGAQVDGDGTPEGRDADDWHGSTETERQWAEDAKAAAEADVEVGEVVRDEPDPDPEPEDVVDAVEVEPDPEPDPADEPEPEPEPEPDDEPEPDEIMPKLVRACVDHGIENLSALLDAYDAKFGEDDAAATALRHLNDPEKREQIVAKFGGDE